MRGAEDRTDVIFWEAAQLAPGAERDAYLARACGEDWELRARVERLLRVHPKVEGFLERPFVGPAATVDLPAVCEGPGSVIGPYKLLEKIGEGGMGLVFMADQLRPVRRKVALKILKPGMDTRQVVARFEAERQTLALMDHPHIAHVFDAGATEAGRPYFVMELVRGIPINEFCDQRRLPTRQRLVLFVTVCQAVQHAHQKGIIHRDLKPSNVLVTLHDGTPLVKVIDFGIAKALGQQLTDKTLFTGFAQMIGTPLYMSPEQAALSNVDVDTRSDIYSLGVLLYELLTGTTPFDKGRFQEVGYDEMRRIVREEEPPRPSTRFSTLGQAAATVSAQRKSEPKRLSQLIRGELDWIVMKALDKDRNRRYEAASAFAADVQRYLHDEPVQACPPSVGYRLSKFVRRNKGVVLAVALVLLTLVGGIVGTTWGMFRADEARQAESRRAEGERRAKRAAEASEGETLAVLDFVESKILAAARPEGREHGLGDKVTLRQAVEAALPFVEKNFAHRPLLEARLRRTLGISFLFLGDPKVAAEQFQAARALFAKHRGPDHPDTLRSMANLAASYAGLGRHADALQLNLETLALRKAQLGPDHPDTLQSMNNLATSYTAIGRHADALRLHQETLARMKVQLGPDYPDTLRSMANLAVSYVNLGRHADALKLNQETTALSTAKLGPDHPDTLLRMANLAVSYYNLGRHAEALRLNQETLALQKAKLGPDHPDTLISMYNLASGYTAVGRHADALKLNQETLARRKAMLGPDHPDTLVTMHELAFGLSALGRPAEALQLYEETLALMKAKFPDREFTLNCMYNLANRYAAVGRHADALKLRKETLALQKAKLGPDHPKTLMTMSNLANSYAALDRPADALKLNEEVLALRKAKLAPDHPEVLRGMWGVAASLIGVGRGTEAVPLIDECVRRAAAGKGVDPRLLPGVLELRLRHFEKAKDAAGCKQTAEMWEKLNRTDRESLYEAACMRAVTAAVLRGGDRSERAATDAAAEADRAMAWLTHAVAAGFTNAAHMRKDSDLDVLRGRDDFQKLLANLEEKPKK